MEIIRRYLTSIVWVDLSAGKTWIWPNSWGWLRLLIPFQVKWHSAAKRHDEDYDNLIDKNESDLRFLNTILSSMVETRVQRIIAAIYYIALNLTDYYYKWMK